MPASSQLVTGNTSHTAPENRVFYPALDGLRGIAFLLVFAQHYVQLPWGNAGVNVFFVLSGFLITGILVDTRDDPFRVNNFYLRRTLRIFPLYYAVFFLLLLAAPLLHWHWNILWAAWPLYLGNFLRFLSPLSTVSGAELHLAADAVLFRLPPHQSAPLFLGHFWSLCVEEQFYLVWPWIVFSMRRTRPLIWLCGATVVLLPFVRMLLQPHLPGWMLRQEIFYRLTPFQLDSLLLGALIALLWRTQYRTLLLTLGRRCALPLLLFCAVAWAWQTRLAVNNFHLVLFPEWRWTFGLSLTNIVSALALLAALQPGSLLHSMLSVHPLRKLGQLSYGAYVYHDIFHGVMRQWIVGRFPGVLRMPLFESDLLIALPCFLLTILLAILSFRFFESRFLDLKERYTRRAA